jgi:hypothetical protein
MLRCGGLLNAKENPDGFPSHFLSFRKTTFPFLSLVFDKVCWSRIGENSNDLNATVRGTVAGDGLTEPNLNFLPIGKKMQIDSRIRLSYSAAAH